MVKLAFMDNIHLRMLKEVWGTERGGSYLKYIGCQKEETFPAVVSLLSCNLRVV